MENNEIIFKGKPLSEIIEDYFDSIYFQEAYTVNEREMLKEGFQEGFEYLYPFLESAERLIKTYEQLEKVRDEK